MHRDHLKMQKKESLHKNVSENRLNTRQATTQYQDIDTHIIKERQNVPAPLNDLERVYRIPCAAKTANRHRKLNAQLFG
jgi:hypothetical protein